MILGPVKTLFSSLFVQISADLEKKWGQKWFQLVWNFLQNPYFSNSDVGTGGARGATAPLPNIWQIS